MDDVQMVTRHPSVASYYVFDGNLRCVDSPLLVYVRNAEKVEVVTYRRLPTVPRCGVRVWLKHGEVLELAVNDNEDPYDLLDTIVRGG